MGNQNDDVAEITQQAASSGVEESINAPSCNEETSVGARASDDDKRPSEEQLLNEASQKLEEKKVIMDYVGRFKTVLDVLSQVGHMTKDVSGYSVPGTIVLTNCVVRFIGPLALRPMPWTR